jgi:ubiquinone/menaquinone biosynthesis C-methylase UbiE
MATRRPHGAASSFASVAELYERARPEYAAAAVAYVVESLDLGPGRVVLDLGAGTGKLSRQLAASGARVIALEPLAEMRALVPEGIDALAGSAEAVPLDDGSVDAVTAAQAFHWFDETAALAEIRRVTRPGGLLALVSNRRDAADPATRAFDELLARVRGHPPLEPPPTGEAFPHVHLVDSFGELAATESSIATLDDVARSAALAEFAALGGGELRYLTYVSIVVPR